jgi:hypothetical protein
VLGGECLHERLPLFRLAGRADRLDGHLAHLLLGTDPAVVAAIITGRAFLERSP